MEIETIINAASKISTPLVLAGVVVGVLWGIFKLIVHKSPIWEKKEASLIILKIINIVGALALVATILGFIGYLITAAPGLFGLSKPPEEKHSFLKYHTSGLENTSFLYAEQSWPFECDPMGEEIMNPINNLSKRFGLVTEFPYSSKFPRIAAGNLYINFTLENHGETLTILDSMFIRVVDRHKIPNFAFINHYHPILEEQKVSIEINGEGTDFYPTKLGTYKYAPNETDLFRLLVLINPKSISREIIEFVVMLKMHGPNGDFFVTSDKHYFLAANISPTEDQISSYKKEIDIVNSAKIPDIYQIYEAYQKNDLIKTESLITKRIAESEYLYKNARQLFDTYGPNAEELHLMRSIIRSLLNKIPEAINDIENFWEIQSRTKPLTNEQKQKQKFITEHPNLPDNNKFLRKSLKLLMDAVKAKKEASPLPHTNINRIAPDNFFNSRNGVIE